MTQTTEPAVGSSRRRADPGHILLPQGFVAEVVASGFNAPVHCCFDQQGSCYVTEAGHKIESAPRILKVDTTTGNWEPFFELPAERWIKTGAMTGACWHDGQLLVMAGCEVLQEVVGLVEVDTAPGLEART
jgi:hypothetical protein